MPEPLWIPDAGRLARARMRAFLQQLPLPSAPRWSYEELRSWSVREPGAFWSQVWDACGVRGEKGARILLDGDRMPGARWFPDAALSFAENLLRRRDDQPAILFRREDGLRRTLTFAGLLEEVSRLQAAFRASGLKAGDRVAAILPNIPEAVTAMLAVASLGGIWSSCSPDFGVEGVLDRFGQIEPRFLLAVDGYIYKGRRFDCLEKLAQITSRLPGLEKTLVLPYAGVSPDLGGISRAVEWRSFLESAPAQPLTLERFPFDQPLYILFSSGTTGSPKCIVHGAGGTLLQHLKEHQLHTDLGPGDRLFYFTTTGWMMWNWLVSALASGSTIVLYDGSPFHPDARALWDLVEQERVTVFGTSAKYLDAVKKAGLEPRESHHLESLRAILSTGSPLVPESFDFVYEKVKGGLQLASISGGTDLISCFALGCPILPVFRGEIQCRGLGMKVEVWNQDGVPVVGEPGELVCTGPFPSMPVRFWNDPGGKRYRAAYFEHFPGVWRHGDWVELTDRGGMVIYGRSDATLNPGGVRIGTAEIYRQVEQVDEVEEAVVVPQEWQGDQRVVLFVKLRRGAHLDEALRKRIRSRIRDNTTVRHVPAKILAVRDIPRTRSGKISEIAVREILHGRPVRNKEALANPGALDQFRNRPELRDASAAAPESH